MSPSVRTDRVPILVIEDEPLLRLEALDMIEVAGFEAVEAADVDDAIRILETRLDIRIVYMDLDVPRGLQGIEIAAEIRERWPPIEIVLTAAFVEPDELDLPVRTEFFSKPINRSAVVAALRRLAA